MPPNAWNLPRALTDEERAEIERLIEVYSKYGIELIIDQGFADRAEPFYCGDLWISNNKGKGPITQPGQPLPFIHTSGGGIMPSLDKYGLMEVMPAAFFKEETFNNTVIYSDDGRWKDPYGPLRKANWRGWEIAIRGELYVCTGREIKVIGVDRKTVKKMEQGRLF